MTGILARTGLTALGTALLAVPAPAPAKSGPQWEIDIQGRRARCTSYDNRPVRIERDDRLGDVGLAIRDPGWQPIIIINPTELARFPPVVAQWWFAHECGHHALPPGQNGETDADCYAVRAMVDQRLIRTAADLEGFAALRGLRGTAMGHLPGPVRVRRIVDCAFSAEVALDSPRPWGSRLTEAGGAPARRWAPPRRLRGGWKG